MELESELSSQQNEASNWKNKFQTLDEQLKSQAELITVKEARNLDLSLKITQANVKMSDLNVKFMELKDKYNSL